MFHEGITVSLIGPDRAELLLMGNAGILRRQRKKPDFFNVSEAAKQGLASKPAEPVQDETPEIVAEAIEPAATHSEAPPAEQPASQTSAEPTKRKRGRPKKAEGQKPAAVQPIKRPRGRPRKVPAGQPPAEPVPAPVAEAQQPEHTVCSSGAAAEPDTVQPTVTPDKAGTGDTKAHTAAKRRGRKAQLIPVQQKKVPGSFTAQVTPPKAAAGAASPKGSATASQRQAARPPTPESSGKAAVTLASVPDASDRDCQSIPITMGFSAQLPSTTLQQSQADLSSPTQPVAVAAKPATAPAATQHIVIRPVLPVPDVNGITSSPEAEQERLSADVRQAPAQPASPEPGPSSPDAPPHTQPSPGLQAQSGRASAPPSPQPAPSPQQAPDPVMPSPNASQSPAAGPAPQTTAEAAAEAAVELRAVSPDPAANQSDQDAPAAVQQSSPAQPAAPQLPQVLSQSPAAPALDRPLPVPEPTPSPAKQITSLEALAASPAQQQAAGQATLPQQSPAPTALIQAQPGADAPPSVQSLEEQPPAAAPSPPVPPSAHLTPASEAAPAANAQHSPRPAHLSSGTQQASGPASQAAAPLAPAMTGLEGAPALSPNTVQPVADPLRHQSPALPLPAAHSSPAEPPPALQSPAALRPGPIPAPAALEEPAAVTATSPPVSLVSSPAGSSAPAPADADTQAAKAAAAKLSPAAAAPSGRTSAASAVLAKAFRIKEPRVSALALPPALLGPAAQPAAEAGTAEQEAQLLLKRAQEGEEKRKLCEQLDLQMLALKRTRPSIAACTAIAVAAAHKGGAGQVVRQIMDAMQGSKESTQRVDLLYLLDSLVQTSQRQNAARSGPSDPLLARLYRDTVSAAVRRVVNCICQDLAGCEKALKVLNIWADRDLLFKPGLEDAKAAALKRQEALLAAKAEEAARQAAAAQALKRAAEAKLNPRSKAPRLAGEDQYGSAGAGRKSLEFGLQRKVADDASSDEEDESDEEDDEEEVVEELHQPAPGNGKGKAQSQSTSQGGLPPGLASSPLDQMGPNFGDDFDEIYSNGLDQQELLAFAGQDERTPVQQSQRQRSSSAARALPKPSLPLPSGRSQADRAASGSAGLLHSHSSAATSTAPISSSAQPPSASSAKLPLPPPPKSSVTPPWLAQPHPHSSLPHTQAAIEGGLSFGPSWEGRTPLPLPGQQPQRAGHVSGRQQYAGYHTAPPQAAGQALPHSSALYPAAPAAWPGYGGLHAAAAAPVLGHQGSHGYTHAHPAALPGQLPPLPPEDDASDPAPPLPFQDDAPPLPPEDDAADPPPLPPGSVGPYLYNMGQYPSGMMY